MNNPANVAAGRRSAAGSARPPSGTKELCSLVLAPEANGAKTEAVRLNAANTDGPGTRPPQTTFSSKGRRLVHRCAREPGTHCVRPGGGGGGKGADGPCARRPTNTIGLPESAFAGPYSHGWGHDLRELRCPAGIATIHLVNRGWPRAERQDVRASSSCGAKLRASHRLRHASAL